MRISSNPHTPATILPGGGGHRAPSKEMLLIKLHSSPPANKKWSWRQQCQTRSWTTAELLSPTELLHFCPRGRGTRPCRMGEGSAPTSLPCKHTLDSDPATKMYNFLKNFLFNSESVWLTAISALTDLNWLRFFFNHKQSVNEVCGREMLDVQKSLRYQAASKQRMQREAGQEVLWESQNTQSK